MTVQQKAKNIKWESHKVTTEAIEARNNHKGCIVWITGLSAAGKSTISVELEKKLFDLGMNVFLLDGDNMRHGLNKDLGFSPSDREENIRRIAEVSKLLCYAGMIVISAFISPYRRDRNFARLSVSEGRFCEVYVECSLEVCKERDPKNLYKQAMEGKIKDFTGISAPYEIPEKPEVTVNTEQLTVEESVETIVEQLNKMGIIT